MAANWGWNCSIGGTSMNHPLDYWWMTDDVQLIPNLQRNANSIRIPNRDGEYPSYFETMQPSMIALKMKVNARGGRTAEQTLQGLMALVNRQVPIPMIRTLYGRAVTADVKFVSAADISRDPIGDELFVTLVFSVPGVYFRDLADVTTGFPILPLQPPSQKSELLGLRGGSFQQVDGMLRFTGPFSTGGFGFRLLDDLSGQTLGYPSLGGSGRRLLLDLATGRSAEVTADTWSMTHSSAVDTTANLDAHGPQSGVRIFRISPELQAGDPFDVRYFINLISMGATASTSTVEYRGRRNFI